MCLSHIGVTFVLGLLIFTPPTYGACPTNFHAKDISREEFDSLQYYFVGRDVKSAIECARFCGKRQFCRTAVFDETALKCAIAYGTQTNCRDTPRRFNAFTSKSIGLVAISCVDFCPSEDENAVSGTSALAPEVSSNGASAQPTTESTPAPPASATDKPLTATSTAPVPATNSVPTSKQSIATSTDSTEVVLHLAFFTPPKVPKDDAVTTTTTVSPTSSVDSFTASSTSSTMTSTTTEPLATSSTEPSTTTTEYTGPAFITASDSAESDPAGDDEKAFDPMGIGRRELPCFSFLPRQALLNAVFATELVNTLAECECLCASSWLSNRYAGSKCKSVQYMARSRECHLNSADHLDGSLQEISGDDGGYYWFHCYTTEHDVTNFVLNECRGLLPAPQDPNGADATAPCFEVINGYLIKGTAGGLEHDVSLEQCQCYCAHSRASGRYAFQCMSATYYHRERDCVLNLDNRINRTDLYVKNDKTEYSVSYMGMTCSPDRARAQFSSHAPEASTGGAEQVCGGFDGKTLVIHVATSDAKFTPVAESSTVTTIGEVDNGVLTGGSTSSRSVDSAAEKHIPESGARVSIALKPGVNSDSCFLELPDYVLEGMALAIETRVTVAACKCYCIDAEKRYGGTCQSFQYYYDSMTCLLNRENRISHPDRFNIFPSAGLAHSYFDYRCAANGVVLNVYVGSTCPGQTIDIPIPKNSEPAFPIQSSAIKFVTPESPDSSSTSGAAFITADPNEIEASTAIATGSFVTSESVASSSISGDAFIASDPNKAEASTSITTTNFVTTESPGSSSTSGAAFITADPNEVEATIATAIFITESTTAASASSAIESPAIISSISEKPVPLAPTKVTSGFSLPPASEPINQETFGNVALGGPPVEVHHSETTATLAPVPLAYEVKTPPHVAAESASTITIVTESLLSTTTEPLTTSPPTSTEQQTTTTTTTTTTNSTTEVPETRTTEAETTTESTTRRTFKPVGPCRVSAIYETAFSGNKLVDKVDVKNSAECFSACKELGCRSANLIQSQGDYQSCELFRDSFIDYRTPDVLAFDSGTVYFDGIECSDKVEKDNV